MFTININIRPTHTTQVNVTVDKEKAKPTKKKTTLIKIATWIGAIAAVIACANDAIEILTKMGIL